MVTKSLGKSSRVSSSTINRKLIITIMQIGGISNVMKAPLVKRILIKVPQLRLTFNLDLESWDCW